MAKDQGMNEKVYKWPNEWEDTHMTNKHMKRDSALLAIRQLQIKTTVDTTSHSLEQL